MPARLNTSLIFCLFDGHMGLVCTRALSPRATFRAGWPRRVPWHAVQPVGARQHHAQHCSRPARKVCWACAGLGRLDAPLQGYTRITVMQVHGLRPLITHHARVQRRSNIATPSALGALWVSKLTSSPAACRATTPWCPLRTSSRSLPRAARPPPCLPRARLIRRPRHPGAYATSLFGMRCVSGPRIPCHEGSCATSAA